MCPLQASNALLFGAGAGAPYNLAEAKACSSTFAGGSTFTRGSTFAMGEAKFLINTECTTELKTRFHFTFINQSIERTNKV